jgi:uncharacterized membrane protein YvbJ
MHDKYLKYNHTKRTLNKQIIGFGNISFLILILWLFSTCSDNNTTENIRLIEKYVKAVETKDYLTMEALLV